MKSRVGVRALVVALAASLCTARCAERAGRQTTVVLDAGATIPPQLVRQASLEIPGVLRNRSCTSGTTVVQVDVDAHGRAVKARVLHGSGEPAFDEACMRSAMSSEYRPATRHGSATAGATRLECRLDCRR